MPTPLTANIQNVKLGACDVTWGTDSLGFTKGGVDVSINTPTTEVTVDQFGPVAVNEYIQGRSITVKVPMAESDLAKLALALPGSTLVVDHTDATKMKLTVTNGSGLDLRTVAKALVLHPHGLDADDKSQDVTVTLASPSGQMDFSFNFDGERVYAVTFKGYPDSTTGELFIMGDESASAT